MTAEPMIDTGVTVHDDDELPSDGRRIVDDGLTAANAAAAPLHEVRALGCFAREAHGTVIGGAIGRTWGRCCELQQLWVHADHRRRGLGTRLVEAFERRAQERGCTVFYLETFSFQAPALYARLGYRAELGIDGFAPGVVKHFMVKEVSASAHGA